MIAKNEMMPIDKFIYSFLNIATKNKKNRLSKIKPDNRWKDIAIARSKLGIIILIFLLI